MTDMAQVLITDMRREDIPDVCRLERECFSLPWSEAALSDYLEKDGGLFLVARIDDDIAGYVGMYAVLDEGNITNVAVFPEYRRQGVGEALISELIMRGEKTGLAFITLEVRRSNSAAIRLYEKCGFIKVGERKSYYDKPNEDAVLMTFFFEKSL